MRNLFFLNFKQVVNEWAIHIPIDDLGTLGFLHVVGFPHGK